MEDTLSAQGILYQGNGLSGMAGNLPLAFDIWNNRAQQAVVSVQRTLIHNYSSQEQVDTHSSGCNYSYQVQQDKEE
jgi:urocanate hydratase